MDELRDAQRAFWDQTFAARPEMFGGAPSQPARHAALLLRRAGVTRLLELGGGQGRDSLFFARQGFQVTVLDYSRAGVEAINAQAAAAGLAGQLAARQHDVRAPLPFPAAEFDACYSHMLFCMALTRNEISRLFDETRRVLRPGGLNFYTARNTRDEHCHTGTPRGEGRFEVGGFIVHFFSPEDVAEWARGWQVVEQAEIEEGGLPRRLYQVVLRSENR